MKSYRVHVADEATVVSRGERVRIWWIRLNDGWVRAAEHPNAQVEALSEGDSDVCPPGTIWVRRIELVLPAHTLLRCHLSEPAPERLEPIEYLRRGRLGVARNRRETYFRVEGNYRLVRADAGPDTARRVPKD
jgi:hypothetical protein